MLLPEEHREPVYADTVLIARSNDPADAKETTTTTTSLTKAIFNLTKSAIGLGALFLPGNMRRMGLIGGIAMLLVGAITCTISLHFLSRSAARTRIADYFRLGERVSGPRHAAVVATFLVLFQIGGLIAYAAFIGQYFSGAVRLMAGREEAAWWWSPQFLSIILCMVAVFPLSCMHDMSRIANASILGMACVFYIFLLTSVDYIVAAVKGQAAPWSELSWFRLRSDFLNAFSSIVFAYVNHFTLVSVVPVLERPTPSRRAVMVWSSSAVVTAVYVGTGLFGYLHFGDKRVTPDILSAGRSTAYAVGQFAMSLVLIASYPLQCDPTRTASDQLLMQAVGQSGNWLSRHHKVRHYGWTVLYVAVPCLIAVTLRPYVMPILEVFSSACGSLLVFILPPFYFLRVAKLEGVDGGKIESGMRVHKWEKVLAYANMLFGAVVLVGGTVGAVIDMVRQFKNMQ